MRAQIEQLYARIVVRVDTAESDRVDQCLSTRQQVCEAMRALFLPEVERGHRLDRSASIPDPDDASRVLRRPVDPSVARPLAGVKHVEIVKCGGCASRERGTLQLTLCRVNGVTLDEEQEPAVGREQRS